MVGQGKRVERIPKVINNILDETLNLNYGGEHIEKG